MDIEKLSNIYGLGIIDIINENNEVIKNNINYLTSLGFSCANEIFCRYPSLFIIDEDEFNSKINSYLHKIGPNYIDELESDLTMFEVLL